MTCYYFKYEKMFNKMGITKEMYMFDYLNQILKQLDLIS